MEVLLFPPYNIRTITTDLVPYNVNRGGVCDITNTYIGSILAAVNPYQPVPGLYGPDAAERYARQHLGAMEPHIYAVANECYRALWKRGHSQCVLISGESGAGKTESTKLILRFLSLMSQRTLEASCRDRTSTSGCVDDKTINDTHTYQEVMNAMRTMQFSEEHMGEILRLLAGVLHAGNIQFMTAGGAQVSSASALSRTADLLGLNWEQLAEVLTHRSMVLRGEQISTPLTVEQCFAWIIRQLNARIRGTDDFLSISILDIFGFENFEVNRFEQFNINYANEKLQEYFNKHIFSLEQLEYNKEGLVWQDINWMDNGECLDLIEKKLGLLALINEESHFPKATDGTLLEKLHSQHSKNSFYVKPRVAVHYFGVKHYAGEVLM
ncbi:hypothetical protein NHX12_003877 [Muraenolepis orangiensis]|uniref:Myosin motor domain-containing protein n=1 Tax=Muraenolepis orangiensis TaxID=630683 RepID=A0A9Q0DTF1_9TELE|nr:hypothetical protein NHX12_003877 [Muraenolepis orangiensis]